MVSLNATALALTIVSALFAAPAHAQSDHLIVPWKRIGPAALGMSLAELTGVMGNPVSRRPGTVEVYNWDDFSATVTKDGLWATQLCTSNPDYATAEGVGPGSMDTAVAALLGPPKYSRVFTGFWRFSYSNLYWPGMMVSVHLKGYSNNHAVWLTCVNHFAAIVE